MIQTGKENYNNIFQDFLIKNNIEIYSRKVHRVPFLQNALIELLEIY